MKLPVTVYSTQFCAFCTQAKRLLTQLKIPFEDVALDNEPELRQRLSQDNNGYRTVPMIYVDGTFIGGYDELTQMNKQGKLAHLIQPG